MLFQSGSGLEAPLHGDLSTFGKAVELSFGASDVNPNNYLSNCVSVTMAKNLGYTNVHEFWKDIYGYDLPDVPLTFPQIIELGKRTGWKCSWVAYQSSGGWTAYDIMRRDYLFHPELGPTRAALYSQPGGIGHCVVFGGMDFMNITTDSEGLICYQQETNGTDVSSHVKMAETIILLYMKCLSGSPQWLSWQDRALWRMIERRRNPEWQRRRPKIINGTLTILGEEKIEKGMIYRSLRDFTVGVKSSAILGVGAVFDDWDENCWYPLPQAKPGMEVDVLK